MKTSKHIILSTLLITLLLGCHPQTSDSLKVLAFGDSGSCDSPTDPASCVQNEIARSMKAICDDKGCDIGIMLGDSIYENGVSSETDDQFQYKYEFHYTPLAIPMYTSLGNHDLWGTTVTKDEQITALINYSDHSTTWRMESEYYDYIKGNVHFFVIDTNDFNPTQIRWLSHKLKHSTANWKVVYGHHPIRSNGYHGDTPILVDKLLPIVCTHADLFVSGHDHDLQLLDSDCGIPLVVSGAAGKIRFSNTDPYASRRRWSTSNTFGFARLIFNKTNFDVFYYDKDGSQLYSRTYNQLFRIQLNNYNEHISDNKTLHVENVKSVSRDEKIDVELLPLKSGNNLWHSAVWQLERYKKYVRIKNKLTGEYIHIDNLAIETAPEGTRNHIGAEIKSWWSAQWELVIPETGIIYLKNRWKEKYLSVSANNKLILTDEPSEISSNWIFSPVDWDSFD